MSKPVTTGQSHNLISVLANNVDWDAQDGNILQEIIDNPQEAGRQFTAFLRNGARMMVEQPTILDCSEAFNPAEFIGDQWKVWRGPATGKGLEGDEARDVRADALTNFDPAQMLFEHCIEKKDNGRIEGEEKLRRLEARAAEVIRCGGQQFLALWKDYQARKENSVLEWLRRNRGIKFTDFPGLVLRPPNGHRYILHLYFDYGEWYWSYGRYLDDDWFVSDPSGLLPAK